MIAELPQQIQTLLAADPKQDAAFWAWVSEAHDAQVVAQAGADHRLVRLKQRFDFRGLEQACVGYRLYQGRQGVEPTYALGQLCRGVVLRAVQQWSYAQLAKEVAANSLLRWFVGAGLQQPTFSATTLWRFEQWLKQHQPRLFFTELLHQIDEDFPAARTDVQCGDTFALLARSRVQSRTQLLRQASGKVLHYLAAVTASGYAQVMAQMAGARLFAPPDETHEGWLDKAARDALAERTALAAKRLLDAVAQVQDGVLTSQDACALACQRWLGILTKILTDAFTFGQDASGAWSQATVRTQHVKGSYVIGSTVDPEASFRQHGDRSQLGYNINVAATPQFIREINAVTGATPDSQGVAPLVAHQLEHLGLTPPKLIYDRAAGSPKIFYAVNQASQGKTHLVARLIDHSQHRQHFGPGDFTLDEAGALTCPHGQTSHTAYRSGSGDGWNYRFSTHQCEGCPLRQRCRGERPPDPPATDAGAAMATAPAAPTPPQPRRPKADAYRQVFISDYRYWQRSALAYTKTAAFAREMRLRATIERTIAGLVRYNGARHATGYGLVNADYQVRMAALAFNLKSWHKLTLDQQKPTKRRTPPPDTP